MVREEKILYPCYFDRDCTRDLGRRVRRSVAVHSPTLSDLESVLLRLELPFHREEDHPHPSQWFKRGGRISVTWQGKKSELIMTIAHYLSQVHSTPS